MAGEPSRIGLQIDVFEKKSERALAQRDLTPPDLVGAILDEFRELEYLTNNREDYKLLTADNRAPLNDALPLSQQVPDDARLILAEVEAPLPYGTKRPTRPMYLRNETSGKVYKIDWWPAIIGRPDPNQSQNDRIAVNFADHEKGMRISRRHAQIIEERGICFIESLSQNPTVVHDDAGNHHLTEGRKQALKNGSVITLEQSQISLKFIVRDDVAPR